MAEAEPTTKPPETDANGFAMLGGFPLNARLRAEALASAGKKADDDEVVTADQIADAKDRLARDKAAAKEDARQEKAGDAAAPAATTQEG